MRFINVLLTYLLTYIEGSKMIVNICFMCQITEISEEVQYHFQF